VKLRKPRVIAARKSARRTLLQNHNSRIGVNGTPVSDRIRSRRAPIALLVNNDGFVGLIDPAQTAEMRPALSLELEKCRECPAQNIVLQRDLPLPDKRQSFQK